MVITKEKYAYKREDGVYVVPLGCLKPQFLSTKDEGNYHKTRLKNMQNKQKLA